MLLLCWWWWCCLCHWCCYCPCSIHCSTHHPSALAIITFVVLVNGPTLVLPLNRLLPVSALILSLFWLSLTLFLSVVVDENPTLSMVIDTRAAQSLAHHRKYFHHSTNSLIRSRDRIIGRLNVSYQEMNCLLMDVAPSSSSLVKSTRGSKAFKTSRVHKTKRLTTIAVKVEVAKSWRAVATARTTVRRKSLLRFPTTVRASSIDLPPLRNRSLLAG